MADFQRLGFDRMAQNIAKSVNSPGGSLVTGDITRGDVVDVTFSSGDSSTTSVKARRVGALPLSVELDNFAQIQWSISDTTLSVTLSGNRSGTISFWVF